MQKLILRTIATFLISLFLVVSSSSGQTSKTELSNADIIKMHTANLSEELIIAKIKVSNSNFDTSPNTLDKLKRLGISDSVILAMIKSSSKNENKYSSHETETNLSKKNKSDEEFSQKDLHMESEDYSMSKPLARYKAIRGWRKSGRIFVYKNRVEFIDRDKPKNNLTIKCEDIVKVKSSSGGGLFSVGAFLYIKTKKKKYNFEFHGVLKPVDEAKKLIKKSCNQYLKEVVK